MDKDHEEEPSTITVSHTVPLGELLVHTSMPAAAVAVKLCGEDSAEEIGETVNRKRGNILSTFKRRTFNRISFKGESGPLLNRYRQTKFSSRRVRKRVVFKHGDCNIVQGNVAKRRRRYLQDIFTTLVDAQWRWTLLVFSMNFLLSWLGFALIWWLIAYSHGDLEPQNYNNETFTPCVVDIRNFASCFLFSVETQHTIGYGAKHITDECPEAIFTLCIQSMTGVILQAFMVGIVFAKLSRPKKRTQTLLFSRNAIICQRDDQPCLMFRVGDMRKSHIIEAHVRAQMIRRKVTKEGELLPFFQTELKVGGDGEEDKIFFIWPTTIVHKIDRYSPLYKVSASDMLRERFEIVVILEGVIESTGMTTQARSSYLPSEILWGHRFQPIITFRKETGEYEVNYTLFNNTYEVDTPLCSAADLDRIRAMHRIKTERLSSNTFPEYHETYSSSSLTMTSESSLRASTGELHMQMPATMSTTPLNPIPVIITKSDDSRGQESINMHPDVSLSSSSAQNEVTKQEYDIKTSKNPEDYDRALENINISLDKKNRNGEEDRNGLKTKLHLKRNEEVRSRSKSVVEEAQDSDLKRSFSRSNADIRQRNIANSSEYPIMPRKSSVSSDDHKIEEVSKKTNFITNEEALIIDPNNSQNISLTEQT
ncbi:PREDICTED: ATP-sensitive inward rectifier potassium channel 12-like isoform X1 [Vollenhovia emeryi]|uniref:ATP-sensitive inward rectifier potassium channel 12-like isoform X1 n=2 Tax=Vollenhovia emeryi TaxID=411798 RepID=UPI0005F37479|nr:PREDICTED: ATP-sensitive inward rectifier potassium channel 12-like isoform X1 [Vollenhovia emeryi]XP_011875768.1 PREDICTED: ATP-sensitive inward rectifier potassium channel 12-like isoform X1 [Vollenhovia emeryi]XP_011875769.1 PREDICTED: ATP-sensitive inward rectifier potassium channel 12-like isoform X1 [Vollenhovia emeryi]XP_011875770.1 PREDICTED: ATP-sensitive inward rectifier potassium channel 12-like isoform X1 [Vollenhovia emeryi]XP_011875771.1 PREDICTED: ATP-sensitive inward rectifie